MCIASDAVVHLSQQQGPHALGADLVKSGSLQHIVFSAHNMSRHAQIIGACVMSVSFSMGLERLC